MSTALRSSLIRLAHSNPELRPHLLPLLAKTAVAKDTTDFVSYVMSTMAPMSEHDVVAFLKQRCKISISPPFQKRTGPRFRTGDRIEIRAHKHQDIATKGTYLEYNGKVGTVVQIDGADVLCKMDTGGTDMPVRFTRGMSPRGVGIYKYTPPFVIEGSPAIEMIYLRDVDARTTADQRLTVDVYLAGAKKYEERAATYYTGHVAAVAYTKTGKVYFRKCPQQRMRVDPAAEGGLEYRTFSPTAGKVLYIGLLGHRPDNWKDALAALKAAAPEKMEKAPEPEKEPYVVDDKDPDFGNSML